MAAKTLLVVGSGPKGIPVPREFSAYRQTRLDVNKAVEPDIVANVVAMPMIADESFDGAYASHVMEHLYFHEVGMALAELLRVLKPGGVVKIAVPDLQSIGSMLALDKGDALAYQGGMGPVTPIDMLYGHRGEVAKGNLWMGHNTGFTGSVLKTALEKAGFEKVIIDRDTKFELIAKAYKGDVDARPVESPEQNVECSLRAPVGQEARLRPVHQGAA